MNHTSAFDLASAAAKEIRSKLTITPETLIVLGSGQGAFADEVEQAVSLSYADIPGFPVSSLPGHAGRLVAGTVAGKPVLVYSGRAHYYQGYDLHAVTHPMRTAALLGCKRAILLNAAGGVNPAFEVGDLMLITDHINYASQNPLIGENDDRFGPRFPDMTSTYTPDLQKKAHRAAKASGFALQTGTYLWTTGPSFETPAEIRFFRTIGADAVGMSTVPEVIVARHMGLDIMGLSLITNAAAGMKDVPLTHEEVLAAGKTGAARILTLLRALIAEI